MMFEGCSNLQLTAYSAEKAFTAILSIIQVQYPTPVPVSLLDIQSRILALRPTWAVL